MERGIKLKIVIVGDCRIGKTKMLENCFGSTILEQHYIERELETGSGRTIKLHIYDTMGQERYRSLTTSYYRGAHGCMLCYDVTNPSTFASLNLWVKDIHQYVPNVSMLLVGICRSTARMENQNSQDVSTRVPLETISGFLGNYNGMKHLEVDINNSEEIRNCFKMLTDLIMATYLQEQPPLQDAYTMRIHNNPGKSNTEEETSCVC